MDEDWFDVTINYQGDELTFEAQVLFVGYAHRVKVAVYEDTVLFEPDEEENYRALVSPEQIENKSNNLTAKLLEAIALQLQLMLKPDK